MGESLPRWEFVPLFMRGVITPGSLVLDAGTPQYGTELLSRLTNFSLVLDKVEDHIFWTGKQD